MLVRSISEGMTLKNGQNMIRVEAPSCGPFKLAVEVNNSGLLPVEKPLSREQ